jgi:hypothetical protein
VRGAALGTNEPWYANAGARLVWDNAWLGSGGVWDRANDTSPPIFPTASIHVITDPDSWSHVPMVRWLSPIAGDVDVVGDLIVDWSGQGGADSSLDVDVVVAHYRAKEGTYLPLIAQVVNKPPAGSATGEVVVIPVELLNLGAAAGDSIIVTLRAHNVVSGRWVSLNDVHFSIVPSTATATVTVTVDPNRAPLAGLELPVGGRALRFDGIDDGASFAGTARKRACSSNSGLARTR